MIPRWIVSGAVRTREREIGGGDRGRGGLASTQYSPTKRRQRHGGDQEGSTARSMAIGEGGRSKRLRRGSEEEGGGGGLGVIGKAAGTNCWPPSSIYTGRGRWGF